MLGVIGEHALVMALGFGPLVRLVLHASEEVAGVGAEYRVGERREQVQRPAGGEIVFLQEAGEAVIVEAEMAVAAFDEDRVLEEGGGGVLGLLHLERA